MKERMLQDMVIKHLKTKGWEYIKINNIKELKSNFRDVLNKRNISNLEKFNKSELSDKEFERFMSLIEHNTSFSDYAKFFLDDDNPITTDEGESLYLNIFNKRKWCENTFQVTEEVSNNGKRHDILLLINGLPICNIEMKRPNVSISNAFEQTKEYSNILTSLTKFIQIFVISNENETRYYANNEDINRKYVFRYSDFTNKPINNVYKFIDEFLDTCIFSKYISRYVINKTKSHNLIALRGYQVHGAEAAINHLKNTDKNGYLWHATGSGKTITSFKVAQIVSEELPQFDKVIFLVDRKDLDSQTIKEYNSFLGKHNQIQETKNSRILLKQLYSSKSKDKLIIATIQKMNNLLKSDDSETSQLMESIKNKKFVFIFDECHRSQFGEMNLNIKNKINDIRYIGFTGTPIFTKENKNELVTADIFNKNLHKYLMPNAIEEGNVLAFQVFYHNETENYDEKDINKLLRSDKYLENIANDIIDNFDRRSINRKYSGLIILEGINTLIKFYKIFKEIQNERKNNNQDFVPLKIGATFSFVENYSEKNSLHREGLKEIIKDFNIHTNSNENIDNVSNYQNRLQSVIKEERKVPEINITLVVDQLLTGFDAKRINSVYVMKSLKNHSLIQAISRTNRIFLEDKERGKVISYVPGFKKYVDESVKTYSDSDNADHVIKRDYEELLSKASEAYKEIINVDIQELLKNPSENKDEAIKYIKRVNSLTEYYKVIRTVEEYDDSKIGADFNIEELNKMIGHSKVITEAYKKTNEWKDIIEQDKENPFDSIDMPIYIDDINTINSEYIRVLLGYALSSFAKGDIKATKEQIEEIKGKIELIDGGELLFDIFDELLEKFKKDNTIIINDALREIFNYKEHKFTAEYKITKQDILDQLYNYKLKERFVVDVIEEWIKKSGKIEGLSFIERDKVSNELKLDIEKHLNLFKSREEILGE